MLVSPRLVAWLTSKRLLVFVGFGGAGLLAQWLRWLVRPADAHGAGLPTGRRWLVGGLCALHLVLAPVGLVAGMVLMPPLCEPLFHACAEALPDEPGLGNKTAIYVNSNDLCATDVHFIRAVQGRQRPARVRLLTSALYDTAVEGIDEHTIELRPAGGWHSNPADSLLRGADNPLPVGASVALSGVHIQVMAHNAQGLVSAVRFRFEVPLRHPSLIWLANRDLTLTPFMPPAPGEVVHLVRAF